jgi:hypothetical protein
MVGCTGRAEGGVELVPVRVAEGEHVDVPYRPLAGLAFVPRRALSHARR